jgi:hypothetical protein
MSPAEVDPCVRRLVDAHFRGDIAAESERRMRAHLPRCATCRGYYERHLVLEKLDPAALGPELRIARGLGLRPRTKTGAAWAFAGACAAAAVVVAVLPRARPMSSEVFAARGASSSAPAEIFAYRATPSERLGAHASVRAGDALAFAYTNAAGFHRLLVYGVDERHHVYWYYPAWLDPMDDPHAVPISPGPELRELPEAIRHDLAGKRLTVHAVFVDDDVTVKRVEALLATTSGLDAPVPLPGAAERVLPLVVEP